MLNENLFDTDQRTEQWYLDRSGKFTGSRFKDLLAFDAKGDPLKAHLNLLQQIIGERLSGRYQDTGMDSRSLKYGRETEPFGAAEYELQTGLIVKPAGFITHPKILFAGVSPDGLVGNNGLEIKCPINWDIHLARFENGMEDFHLPQVQGSMWVTDAEWWDFVSYQPFVKPHLQFYRERIYRDDEYIANLEKQVYLAESKVRERLEFYNEVNIEQILIDRVKEPNHD